MVLTERPIARQYASLACKAGSLSIDVSTSERNFRVASVTSHWLALMAKSVALRTMIT